MLAVEKLHIVHKNRMHRNEATGSESDVDVGMGKVRAHCTAENTYFQVSAVTNSHEANFETGWNRNRFRLTETIYMKLRH